MRVGKKTYKEANVELDSSGFLRLLTIFQESGQEEQINEHLDLNQEFKYQGFVGKNQQIPAFKKYNM